MTATRSMTSETLTTIDTAGPQPQPALEAQLLAEVNAHRLSLGLHPVALSANPVRCAEWKSCDQALLGYQAHDDMTNDGTVVRRSIGQRFNDFGMTNTAWGEVIAYGFEHPADALAAWLSEPADGTLNHRGILEYPFYTHCGVGIATAPAGTYGATNITRDLTWYTIDFVILTGPPSPDPVPDPTPVPVHDRPVKGDTWVSKTSAKATVHVDLTFVKKAIPKVTYTNRHSIQITTTEARFLQLFKFVRSA